MRKVFVLILTILSSLLNAQEEATSNERSIPYAKTEKVPIYPGCESASCTQIKIRQHITDNFNQSLFDSLQLESGQQRIYVQFMFGVDGKIHEIRARSGHKILEAEAIRVVSNLPKFTPGQQHGRPVNVKYTLPISFYYKPN